MNTAEALLRPDLRAFAGYRSARSETADGDLWLNANEFPWPNGAAAAALRRYPQPQPGPLREALAGLYGVQPEQLLIGRGSDEAIDLLLRAFCRAGRDAIVIAPPVFGMYAVCAGLQGARVVEVPLLDGADGWFCDLDAIGDAALANGAKLVFLCSPGNPTGDALAIAGLDRLSGRLAGRALVVVDEAYAEFGAQPSALGLLAGNDNLVVLRTLSKAHALAGARIGCAIASPGLIAALRRCQAPYPVPEPCASLALRALRPAALDRTRARIACVRQGRDRLQSTLAGMPVVRRVYPSQANFLLVRFQDAESACRTLLAAGIVVRDMRGFPQLGDALRITIGTREQNARVAEASRSMAAAAQPALAVTRP